MEEKDSEIMKLSKDFEACQSKLESYQDQLEKLSHLYTFSESASEIAHEINNPVNYISGSIRIINRGVQDFLELMNLYKQLNVSEDQIILGKIKDLEAEIDLELTKKELKEASTVIELGMVRIHEIAHNLSLLGKGEDFERTDVILNNILKETIKLVTEKLPTNIQIHLDLQVLPLIKSYRGKLNQVFLNFIKNSIEAIQEKESKSPENIWIHTSMDDHHVLVSIKDTGVGMSEETKSKIFDKFYTTKSPGKGTGLGMGVCRSIILKHKGTIHINSERGKGAEFIIKLPR